MNIVSKKRIFFLQRIGIFILCFSLISLSSCVRSSNSMSALRSKWKGLKKIWGEDAEGMLASEGFYGPLEEEFIPLEEDDLQTQFADPAIPQPREIPGKAGGSIPSLNQFKKAIAEVAQIFQNIYFNTDDHVIRRPEYVQVIDRVAAYLKKNRNVYISVAGHCDERGSESYNLALGTRRSNYVRSLLIQRGIGSDRVHTISFGKEQPVEKGHNVAAWSRNRRTEFKLFEK